MSGTTSLDQHSSAPLRIWVCHDERAGHISQLQGLTQALSEETTIETKWLNAKSLRHKTKSLLKPSRNQNSPDIVIGAGHSTHTSLLLTARSHDAKSFVLMKPSLPLFLFDGVICPKHDGLEQNARVHNTIGPITKIRTPNKSINRTQHTIIVGGPSKHFLWDDEAIIHQISTICQSRPEINWSLSDSPRTPSEFVVKLRECEIDNLHCHHYKDFGDIESILKSSAFTWITPDSMSMIYESLTAESPTALLTLATTPKSSKKRICRHISELLNEGPVIGFEQWQSKLSQQFYPPKPPAFNEAQKAAKWLLSRYHALRTK